MKFIIEREGKENKVIIANSLEEAEEKCNDKFKKWDNIYIKEYYEERRSD